MSQVHAHTDGTTLHISLAGTLTIAEATETRLALVTQLAQAEPDIREVRLDLSAVPEVDTAGIQLLLSASRTVLAQGRTASLERSSGVVQTVSLALGAADTSHCCGFAHSPETGAMS